MNNTLLILIMGIFATVTIDLWALLLKHGLKQQTTDWGMAGRWFANLPRGQFIHRPISKTAPVKHEQLIGWTVHYIVGVTYAAIYIEIVNVVLETEPTLTSASIFGIATVIAPWFIMQPGFGMGIMARLAPSPNIKRLMSLSVHFIFGIALYVGWLIARGI